MNLLQNPGSLIATTALVATATVAAADVSVSGMARFGVSKAEGKDATVATRVLIDLKGSTTTDAGYTLGGKFRLRDTSGSLGEDADLAGGQVTMGMGDVTVSAGNIAGPLDSLANVYGYTVGFTGMSFNGLVTGGDKLGYQSNKAGAQGLQVDYAANGFAVAAAWAPKTTTVEETTQIAASYAMGGLSISAGMQSATSASYDVTVATVGYSANGFGVIAAYGDNNGTKQTTVSASYTVGGATVKGYVNDDDADANNAYGVGVSYGLGGGATAAIGYEQDGTSAKANTVEAGVTFSF